MDNVDKSNAYGYPSSSLRVSLITCTVLAVVATLFTLWYSVRLAQVVGMEALWRRGHAELWALWACLWWVYVARLTERWRAATPEEKRAPSHTIDPWQGAQIVWQLLLNMAIVTTLQSYKGFWPGALPRTYAAITFGLYASSTLLSVMLIWAIVRMLRSRHKKPS